MDILFAVFDILKHLVLGFLGLFAGLFVLALLFGKRVEKKWDFEANFREARGREIGELEIELSRVLDKKAQPPNEFELHARFVLRHPALVAGESVRVGLDGTLLFDSTVLDEGRVRLDEKDLVGEIKSPAAGQIVSVEIGGAEVFSEPLERD